MYYEIWTEIDSFECTFENSFIFCCYSDYLIYVFLFEGFLLLFWHLIMSDILFFGDLLLLD